LFSFDNWNKILIKLKPMDEREITHSHILVVDDEEDYCHLVKTVLEPEGFRITTITDGEKALKAIPKLKPDLVILDVNMPKVDGYEVCRKIREELPESVKYVPIIMLTVRRRMTDKVKGLDIGADDYITKQFCPQELVMRVKSLLKRA